MSSRKEQKEQLRREREEREVAAKAAARKRQLIGYGAGAALVLAVAVVLVVLLAGGDGGGSKAGSSSDAFPSGGEVPDPKLTDLDEAVKAAGCELKSRRANSREHSQDLAEQITYSTNPPTSGKHFAVPAEDGAYETAPDVKELVHSLEHGRVIIWVKKSLPKAQRANIKALYDEDTFQMLLVPNETNMPYAVAASAWNADPAELGTGQLLGCPRYNEKVFDAIRAFKDEHRSNGPEPVP